MRSPLSLSSFHFGPIQEKKKKKEKQKQSSHFFKVCFNPCLWIPLSLSLFYLSLSPHKNTDKEKRRKKKKGSEWKKVEFLYFNLWKNSFIRLRKQKKNKEGKEKKGWSLMGPLLCLFFFLIKLRVRFHMKHSFIL